MPEPVGDPIGLERGEALVEQKRIEIAAACRIALADRHISHTEATSLRLRLRALIERAQVLDGDLAALAEGGA